MSTATAVSTPTIHQAGLQCLQRLVPNESLNSRHPSFLLFEDVRRSTGVDVADLRAGALGLDAEDSETLRWQTIDHVAFVLGEMDGRATAAAVLDVHGVPSEIVRALWEQIRDAGHGRTAQEQRTYDAYRRGHRAALAAMIVPREQPGQWRALQSIAEHVGRQQDPVLASEHLASIAHTAQLRQPLAPTLLAYAELGLATAMVDQVMRNEYRIMLAQIGAQQPYLTPDARLRAARAEFRSRAATHPDGGQGWLATAWYPMRISETRVDGPVLVGMPPTRQIAKPAKSLALRAAS